MKYLLFFLGFLVNLVIFSLLITSAKADECSTKKAGDSCGAYIRVNATNCQTCYGACSTQLTCVLGSNDFCSQPYTCSGSTNPTPTGTVTIAPTSTPTSAPPPAQAGNIITGVQVPDTDAIGRLVPSQYSFQWVKYQHQLGTDPSATESWISRATSMIAGGNQNYQVLISVAKNEGGIEELKNPPYPEKDVNNMPAFTQKYCPWDDELDSYDIGTGEFYVCGQDAQGKPRYCERMKTIRMPARSDNGYVKFRDLMMALAPKIQRAGGVEVWNEPNLAAEWTAEGLGPISPENYANFLVCGIKGLRRGGYNGPIITAAMAPLAGGSGNMDDFAFFDQFLNAYKSSMTSRENPHGDDISAFGWHANVTSDLPPESNSNTGFQRFTYIKNRGKPIWLTEFGWDRSKFPNGLDDQGKRQLQGYYVAKAYEVIKDDFSNIVKAMFVWNFGFTKAGQTADEFVQWDIEGVVPAGIFCQPNAPIDPKYRKDRGNTVYVQDKSLTDDTIVATVAGQALIPQVVIEDANKTVEKLPQRKSGTNVDTKKSFFDNLPLFGDIIRNIASLIEFVRCFYFKQAEFCKPNISVGATEKLIDNKNALGKNIPKFASDANILGKTAIPANMELTPELKDCNIGKLGTAPDPGNTNLDELSETMGNTTGFYGNNMPDFKTLTPSDWDGLIKDQMQKENLNIGNKLFNQDRRSPDMYLRKQVFCKGNYPNGICPFEPTPTP